MLQEHLANNIAITDKVVDWKEAIQLAAQPLLANGSITENYINAMIESVEKLGFYIVLTEGLAMPHARPECGALKLGLSLLKINEPVKFGTHDVNIVIVLAASDSNSHIDLMMELSELLTESDVLEQLRQATNKETILNLLKGPGK